MSDIIQLLPDSVANQIAAGEVIQRPASAVKELMENAVDAGSSQVQLIIRDAGKTLIQVMDDGIGMSVTDARLSFERHATSKIRSADDLLSLHTMGFRGEALASIAAIAQVELKTRRNEDEVGTSVIIEGADFISQENCVCNKGTSIAIRNLFYNVPARRNFLKSNPVETRHIVEEFTRVALAHPEIAFSLHHNEMQVFDLRKGNLRQRIAAIFGATYNERLVPVEEDTTIVKLSGFVCKPEFAKKNRGEQYFFVNNRFIKDGYLHHAVGAAFENMISKDSYPSYFINLQIDPSHIDVNIHPTKTEIKFVDEKSVYAIMRAAVKRALGKFSVTPSLDFDQERSFDIPLEKLDTLPVHPTIKVNPNYNPFKPETLESSTTAKAWNPVLQRQRTQHWHQLYKDLEKAEPFQTENTSLQLPEISGLEEISFFQLQLQMIVVIYDKGLLLIDQQLAHEQILYEQNLHNLIHKPAAAQQQLFPQTLEFTPEDAMLLKELQPDLRYMGFDINEFGMNAFVLHGAPAEVQSGEVKKLLQQMMDQYKHNRDMMHLETRNNLALSYARSVVMKKDTPLSQREMKHLVTELMNCENPFLNYSGKNILIQITSQELLARFNKK